MKKTLITITMVAASFAAQAQQDLMTVKESQLTYEQKKELYSTISQADFDAIDAYDSTVKYKEVIHNTDKKDLSFKEKIEFIKQQTNKVVDVKNK